MNTDMESIKRKLRGILAKTSEGSGATEAESNSALEFARRLMLRHQLTEADLGLGSKQRTPSEIAADTEYADMRQFSQGVTLTLWEKQLAQVICELIGTIGAYDDHGKYERRTMAGTLEFNSKGQTERAQTIVFYGPAADVRDARELHTEWAHTIAALARMKFGGALRGEGRSYADGFVAGMKEKVRELKASESAMTQGNSGNYALVVAGANAIMRAKRMQASDWLSKEKGVRLKVVQVKSTARNYYGANSAGRADGKNADLSRNRAKRIGG